MDLVTATAVVAVEKDNLGGEVANLGGQLPALKPDHVPLKPAVVQTADAHLAGFNRLPSFLPHGREDLARGQERVSVRRSGHRCLCENRRGGAPDFAVGDFDGV